MVEKISRWGLILVLAGLGGLIRQAAVTQFGVFGLVACNYGAVYGLVSLPGLRGLKPNWVTGLSVGFFGGLSSIGPILYELALALAVGDWLRLLKLVLIHGLGGYLVALLAHSRAVKASGGGEHG